jgi:hypothetical protein
MRHRVPSPARHGRGRARPSRRGSGRPVRANGSTVDEEARVTEARHGFPETSRALRGVGGPEPARSIGQ